MGGKKEEKREEKHAHTILCYHELDRGQKRKGSKKQTYVCEPHD